MIDNKYINRNEKTASRIIDGQAVIMTLEDNTLHTLNEIGSMIWELSDGVRSIEDMAAIIHDEHKMVDYEKIRTDCQAFVKELLSKGMLILQDNRTEEKD